MTQKLGYNYLILKNAVMKEMIWKIKCLGLAFYVALFIMILGFLVKDHWVGVSLGVISGWIGTYYFIKEYNPKEN